MSQPSFKEYKKKTDEIYQRYEGNFAGKPRVTRDLNLLDEILEELEGVVEEVKSEMNGGRDPAMISLMEMARENLEIYRKERKEIVAAKERGPTSLAASRVVTRANVTFGKYHRHFAGKDRRTRDLGLLTEIIVELEGVLEKMKKLGASGEETLGQNVDVVEKNLDLYRKEFRAIEEAQRSGTLQEESDTLATLANYQFGLYRVHFAGKPRHTRRTGLLERMVNQLQRIKKGMRGLKRRGLVSESNDRNIEIVTQNISVYQKEIKEIGKARESLTTEQIAGSLGSAANEIMAEYREHFAGQNRATRDLEKLSQLCDQLGDIASVMRDLERRDPSEMNAKNLDIVIDSATMYEGEYRKVEEAKQS